MDPAQEDSEVLQRSATPEFFRKNLPSPGAYAIVHYMKHIKCGLYWYDFWVGAYWDRRKRILYVCPFPMLCIELWF
jgi:hypothetical protein